ncbi:MAG: aldose 1-epimerase [Paludisphaera borealis]|uniref:aldose 1-epimerase n=1 Tax=Paludisphaera borealis TaxID=1387353 RepID=UPI0028430DA6|nr:aldose 1-epimerase [Paludisphaera borealis]MDR3619397.1 aldose 1-epimerase [Paludisphaera borealis]
MSFRISVERRGDRPVYSLYDDGVGSSASILPSFGFNLFDLRLPVAGEVRPVIVSADTFAEAPSGPGGNGVPILFPFPNRIRDGAFGFQGRTFDLAKNNGPNAIHGFVYDRAWEVVEHRATADEAFLVGRFQLSKHAPEVCDHWPADAVLQVRYGLSGRRVTMTTTISNPTAVDLPYGFGIHPYFRLPFAPGGDLGRTKIVIPASKSWALKDFLPTGEVSPVDPRLDFREGKPIQGLKLDDVLTDLAYDGAEGVCRLVDLDKGGEFQLGFDRSFRELVVYTPPGKPDVISIEPYTQTTDAINLQAKGVSAGLRVLGHGQSDVLTLTMQTKG